MSSKAAPGLLVVLSAPSGAGKTSISRALLSSRPALRQSVSCTTREKRGGEVDGVDYHFVSRAEFDRMVACGAFAEWAEVHGNRYGTTRSALAEATAAGQDILLDIDVQGAAQIRASGLDAVFIFILPPSLDELRQRLAARDTDAPEVIERRLANAAGEIRASVHADFIVVNDRLADAIARVEAILCAEKARRHRVIPTLPDEFGLK